VCVRLLVCVCVSGSHRGRPLLFPEQRGESTHTLCFSAVFPLDSNILVLVLVPKNQVQMELKRAWRGLSLERYGRRDFRPHAASVSRSGLEGSARFPRSCRAQSILQTETTGLWAGGRAWSWTSPGGPRLTLGPFRRRTSCWTSPPPGSSTITLVLLVLGPEADERVGLGGGAL